MISLSGFPSEDGRFQPSIAGIICALSLSMRNTMLPPVMMLETDSLRMMLAIPVTSVAPSLANLVCLLVDESIAQPGPRTQPLGSDLTTVRP